MDHVGIVVDDLAAATSFFVELGLPMPSGLSTSREMPASVIRRGH